MFVVYSLHFQIWYNWLKYLKIRLEWIYSQKHDASMTLWSSWDGFLSLSKPLWRVWGKEFRLKRGLPHTGRLAICLPWIVPTNPLIGIVAAAGVNPHHHQQPPCWIYSMPGILYTMKRESTAVGNLAMIPWWPCYIIKGEVDTVNNKADHPYYNLYHTQRNASTLDEANYFQE